MRPRNRQSPQSPSLYLPASSFAMKSAIDPEPLRSKARQSRHGVKQRRLTKACDNCHRRKIRCDGRQPCERCLHLHIDCLYTPSNKKRGPKPKSTTGQRTPKSTSKNRTDWTKTQHLIDIHQTPVRQSGEDARSSGEDDAAHQPSPPSQFDLTSSPASVIPGHLSDFELAACEYFLTSKDLNGNSNFLPIFVTSVLRQELGMSGAQIPACLRDAMTSMTTHFLLVNQDNISKNTEPLHGDILMGDQLQPMNVDEGTVQQFWDQLLDKLGWRYGNESSIAYVQTALLLTIIAMCRGNGSLAWRSVNNAISEATLFGLDRNYSSESDGLSDIDRECRRRCWWACVYLKQLLIVTMYMRSSMLGIAPDENLPLPNPLFSCDGSDESCPESELTIENGWTGSNIEQLDDFGLNVLITNDLFKIYSNVTSKENTDMNLAPIREHARQIRRRSPTGTARDVVALGMLLVTSCPKLLRFDISGCKLDANILKLAHELATGVNALSSQTRVFSPLCSLFVVYGAFCQIVNIITSIDKKSVQESASDLDIMMTFLRKTCGYWYVFDRHMKFLEALLSPDGIVLSKSMKHVIEECDNLSIKLNYKSLVKSLLDQQALPLMNDIEEIGPSNLILLQQHCSKIVENPLFDYNEMNDESTLGCRSNNPTPVTITSEITSQLREFTLPGVGPHAEVEDDFHQHSNPWNVITLLPTLSVDPSDTMIHKHGSRYDDSDENWH